MRLAIASEDDSTDSMVSEVSGRAPYYLIFEGGKLIKTLKNPFAVGGGGAGFGVIQMLANDNVELVFSGKFGEHMINALKEKGMRHRVVLGKTVGETLEEVKK